MQKIKVLHVVESLGGGVFTYIKDLTFFFRKHNTLFDTTVAYCNKRPEVSNLNLKKELSNGVSLIEVDINKEISLRDFKSLYDIIKIYYSLQPDIIHLHSSKAGVLGKFASLFYRKAKVFYTPHGYSFLRKDIMSTKNNLFYYIEKYTTKFLGGTTIACGDSEYDLAKELGKALLVRNGINVPYILNKHKSEKLCNNRIVIGTIGRIAHVKNPDLFNKIALNNPDLDFLWIGDGDSKEILNAPNIHVTGWLNREKIFEHLNKLDIYIQTSLREGLPIAPLEAMIFQKPVLETNTFGNKDVVTHEKTGFLFTNENDAQKYINILKDLKICKKMGKAGMERCMEYFDLNKNFISLLNIYLDCLHKDIRKD